MPKKEERLAEPIECILWDFDNTLYKPNGNLDLAMKKLLYEELKKNLGEDSPALYEATKQKTGGNIATLIALRIDPYTYSRIFRQVATDYLKEDQKLVELFRSLDDYDHMLVTNNSTPVVHEMCEYLGLQPFSDYFTGVIGLETLLPTDYKPSTKPWEKALNATNMSGMPQRCLAVGDDILKDIVPAKTLGMHTVLVTWGDTDFDPEIPNFHREEVYDISELLGVIDKAPSNRLDEFDGKEEVPSIKDGSLEAAVRGKLEMAEEEKKAEEESRYTCAK